MDDNLYSLLISQLCIKEPGVQIVGVIILKVWSVRRIFLEFRRLGVTLFRKVLEKYIFQDSNKTYEEDQVLGSFINKVGLEFKSHRKICNNNEIPYLIVKDPNDKNSIEFLRKQKPEIILSIGSHILRKPFLVIPPKGVFNVHKGILPEYRGIGGTEWPIIEGRLEDVGLGITLHIMERGIDTGPVILKRRIPIDNCNTINKVESKYLPEMVDLMISGVRMARDNNIKLTPQKKQDGRQYFSLHKRMKSLVAKKLGDIQ